jgi:hypothetical protein
LDGLALGHWIGADFYLHIGAAALTVTYFLSCHWVKLYTILPEVFLPNLLVFSIFFLSLEKWYFSEKTEDLGWVFLSYGLAFAHHHTLALTVPGFALLFFLKTTQTETLWFEKIKQFSFRTLSVLVGILPLLYFAMVHILASVRVVPPGTATVLSNAFVAVVLGLWAFRLSNASKEEKRALLLTAGSTLGGFLVGSAAIWWMFAASKPEPTYAYYIVNTFEDLLFVLFRKGYGTFSLTVFQEYATKEELFRLVLNGLLKNVNVVGLIWILPVMLPSVWKNGREKLKQQPALIVSLVTLALYFAFFVPNSNIPLTFEKYKHVVLRFITIPTILSVYPAYYAFRHVLKLWESTATRKVAYAAFGTLYAVLLAGNLTNWKEIRFGSFDLLDTHIQRGFDTMLSTVSKEPVLEIGLPYRRCVTLTRPDALVFGVRYHNHFKSKERCFAYTMASFSGQFRSRAEEQLAKMALGAEFNNVVSRYAQQPEVLMRILFEKLKERGFRIFLFFPTDSVVFQNTRFRYRPVGNIQELILDTDPQFPIEQLGQSQIQYLQWVQGYLNDLEKRQLPYVVLDESVMTGVFQNIWEYRKLLSPLYPQNPQLAQLDGQVQQKYDALFGPRAKR